MRRETRAPDFENVEDLIASRGGRLGKPLQLLPTTTSTNDEAKLGARSGAPHGSTWVAETQSQGRGRQGRVWTSPPGENLLFSVLLRIPCVPSRVPPLALVCGLAVRDAIANALGRSEKADDLVSLASQVKVKWPNDVVFVSATGAMKKISGTLVESSVMGSKIDHIVVGIGVNVHTRDFPPELAEIATSIALLAHVTEPNRGVLLADIVTGLDRDIEHVAHRGLGLVHARLTKHDALVGRDVSSDDGTLEGVACGMDIEGRLLVRKDDGSVVKVTSGEVRIKSA